MHYSCDYTAGENIRFLWMACSVYSTLVLLLTQIIIWQIGLPFVFLHSRLPSKVIVS